MSVSASRQSTVYQDTSVYLSSESGQSEWGQPAASHYVFMIAKNHLVGHLIQGQLISEELDVSPVDQLLKLEMSAWDAASDEDWSKFESSL